MQEFDWSNQPFILHCVRIGRVCFGHGGAGRVRGFDGNVTYPKAHELRSLLELVPRDRLLIETDAPYLPPQPYRGQTCEPVDDCRNGQVSSGVSLRNNHPTTPFCLYNITMVKKWVRRHPVRTQRALGDSARFCVVVTHPFSLLGIASHSYDCVLLCLGVFGVLVIHGHCPCRCCWRAHYRIKASQRNDWLKDARQVRTL